MSTWRIGLLLCAGWLGWSGCTLLLDTSAAPGDFLADVGADVPLDADDMGNACGGQAPLTLDGASVSLFSSCGCGGTLVCNGSDAVRCVGELPLNACGGCGNLTGSIGASCGACGGTWICGSEGDVICVGQARANGCGGCDRLAGAPGRSCEGEPGENAAWVCNGADDVVCRSLIEDDNACGGAGALVHAGAAALPGESCEDADRLCASGVLVCTPEGDGLVCEGRERNAAGGCGALLGSPGMPCGCAGAWVADAGSIGGVRCDGGTPNACGGCETLHPAPGDPCDADDVVVCVGLDDTVCVSRTSSRNACGGTSALQGTPGNACGACNTGRWACDGPNRVTCSGDKGQDAFNVCDGSCAPLGGGVGGGACGACSAGVLACGAGPNLTCEAPASEPHNACGGCGALAGVPETACGRCATWRCTANNEAVACALDATLPGCEGEVLRCQDLDPPCARLHRDCVESSGEEDARCGACLAGYREEGGTCVSETPAVRSCGDAACAVENRICVQPDVDLDATCGGCLPGFGEVGEACTSSIEAPQDLAASEGTSATHVALTWQAVSGASGYHVYRDGTRVTSDAITATTYNDADAPGGGVPPAVENVQASTNRTSDVNVTWEALEPRPGIAVAYAVRAVAGDQQSNLSDAATGFRAGLPILGYEVQIDGGGWNTLESTSSWVDANPPPGSISAGSASATTNLSDRVGLQVGAATATPGPSRSYRVRAFNQVGPGDASDAASGRRSVGTPSYQWQWSATQAGNFVNLSGAASRTASDMSISADATRWYRVLVRASGAPELTVGPVEGRRTGASGTLGEPCDSNAQCPPRTWCPANTEERRCSPRPSVAGVEMPFQWVPRGTFMMGSPDEEVGRVEGREAQVSVTLTRDYFVQRTPVTQAQWEAVMSTWNDLPDSERRMPGWSIGTPEFGTSPSCFLSTFGITCIDTGGNPNGPVERVSWWDAIVFANALSILEGLTPCYTLSGCSGAEGVQGVGGGCEGTATGCTNGTFSCASVDFVGKNCAGYRLPTEAEWERAARAGSTTATYSGDLPGMTCEAAWEILTPISWNACNAGNRTQPVAIKFPNAWGLYDTLGNVREWTWNRYSNAQSDGTDPLGPSTGGLRTLRGAAFNSDSRVARAAFRAADHSETRRYFSSGFRLVRTAP